jgi:glutathione synthase
MSMNEKTIRLGVIMDPIQKIKPAKDSTLAMLLEAQGRGWEIWYMEQASLRIRDGRAMGYMRRLEVQDNGDNWYRLGDEVDAPLGSLDVILMRKDPPFDMEYVFTTYILDRAQVDGALIVNDPRSLRDVNEKAFTSWFPQCCPANLITRSSRDIKAFLDEHKKIVVKPLDGMGGQSIFLITQGDLNTNVIIETITRLETRTIQVQAYIPEIASSGDKRILLVAGEPIPYALARIPPPGDARGNMAVGGTTRGLELSDRDRWICQQLGPTLREKGLMFVGLDVIGDYLTEINVTSPTGIRELDRFFGTNIAATLCDAVQARLRKA